ncbi:major Facilitator Superfamily protein [Roseovarius sp. A-2]|uniref:MFS transporter n=1 Tax=Roseovarius sp. A-2 TaxID=1570360 RepID=UPI0009B579FB|nr:MFS transporter [Roseovarius sp. A-2]GAW36565.1 major Facilitator Superfamily protein [Roseovarius sp. A-2]
MTTDTPQAEHGGWHAIIGSSSIMSLALLGDALLYAVLPVYAEAFGLTLPWVGVMLSVNRFVRVFAYGLLARLTQAVGVRRMCMVAAITATASTAIYGFGQGPAIMLAARVLWGLTYAVLVLATLSYAIENRRGIGTRVGIGQAIQRLGPILALLGGAWLIGVFGPNMTFALLAIPTALSLLIAFSLPKARGEAAKRGKTPSLARPTPIDIVYFLQGYGVDGVFAVSITLIFAREASLSEAVMGGSALLAVRHFGEAIAAPLFGWIADRFGARKVFVTAAVLTTLGFVMVAAGLTVAGALIMLIFRGALASLGPAVIAQGLAPEDDAIAPLARMQAWRDFGAAVGPLATGFLLTAVAAEVLHAAVAVMLAASLVFWLAESRRSRAKLEA